MRTKKDFYQIFMSKWVIPPVYTFSGILHEKLSFFWSTTGSFQFPKMLCLRLRDEAGHQEWLGLKH